MKQDAREIYYKLVKEQAEKFEAGYAAYYKQCVDGFAETGCRCDDFAPYAYMEYALYCYTKDESHAKKAVQALTDMGKLSDAFLESSQTVEREKGKNYTVRQAVLTSGRPLEGPMETMFCPTYYLLACHGLMEKGLLTEEDKAYCEKAVFRSIKPLFAYTDWGPQNRGMIKGSNLMLAGACFPNAPKASECIKLGEVLCDESLGKWSIEDAQVYVPIWLNQVIVYQNVCGNENYYRKPIVKFYFDYMMELMTPQGMIPEFGDGRYLNSAEAYICCLEKGASVYHDGRMRYAAAKITEYMLSFIKPYRSTFNNVCFLANALLWSDETIAPEPFVIESGEVPEDLIGKKYRFCSGEGKECQYLLFNYRDEGDYARRVRSYMRATLVVEHEKMHHGHSDENSIVLLQAGDSILLRDGGYRDMDGQESLLPGSYRSDFYHNKLVVRKGLLPEGKDFIEFCSGEPHYTHVRTDKIYFERFAHCEVGRTKLEDVTHGTESDRVILYDKDYQYYLVLDTVKALESGDYTFGPLYYGQELSKEGEDFYLRNLEVACDQPFEERFPNSQDYRLRVVFPDRQMTTGSRKIRRSYHEETGLYQIFSGHLEKGQTVSMVTLLQPVKQAGGTKEVCISEVLRVNNGVGIRVVTEDGEQLFAFRDELTAGHKKGIRKPEYDFADTAVRYGDLYTDALFSHVWEKDGRVSYEVLSFTRVEYREKLLWQVPASSLIQGDWTLAEYVSEWNKWYGEA